MSLAVPVVMGIVLALLLGGSFRNLATLRLHGAWMIVAPFLIQALLYSPLLRASAMVQRYGVAIYVAILVLMLAGVLRNLHLGAGLRIALVGLILNLSVIVANGGRMPASSAAMRAVLTPAQLTEVQMHSQEFYNRQQATSSTRLVLLADEIAVPFGLGHGDIYSVGDVLLMAGVALLAFQGVRRPRSRLALNNTA